jgi:two-component system, OmpR family, sensor histidine kinase TctE
MDSPVIAGTSIRRYLLIFLVSSLLVVVLGAATVTYWVAVRSANNAYDRALLDPAIDIAENIRIEATGPKVDLPQKALDALVFDQVDKVMYQVRTTTGEIVAGVRELPPAPRIDPGNFTYFDGEFEGEAIRIAGLATPTGFVVQVGETLHKRNGLVREILLTELVPTCLIAIGSIVLAWYGVARALRPLESLRRELLEQAASELHPLSPVAAPVEIAPVIEGFNRLLEKLREGKEIQQRFLANAAHQLRTPLAGLQMHLELLLRRDFPADVRMEIERMHIATVRASRLANQLLALAKAESAHDRGRRFETIDLRTIADAAARAWAPKAIAEKIDLGFALESATVQGDALLLPELLDNLIDNALRYTPERGAVTVTTGYQGTVPYLSVEDSGPGIPIEERGNVFERFYRVSGTPGEGSGLGLSIVREVVERHLGVVQIGPRNSEGGTRIEVWFPVVGVRGSSVLNPN